MFRCRTRRPARGWLAGGLLALLAGCSSLYYDTLENMGVDKRELLAERVDDARNAQHAAAERFDSALETFREVVRVPDSELSRSYARLDAEYRASAEAADRVDARIDDIESVAEALFDEWHDELDLYQRDDYRQRSARRLEATRAHYAQMIGAMHDAAESMQPVLATLHDNVLLLKHNLNARAIDALQGEVDRLETRVADLRRRMRAAIARSDAFIADLDSVDARR
ncbi:DUF2959 family protein [Modicisalibacter coralii]|uniref:DUF2959 family protein n=1 Tax=Modicisalibacter coralii TaxID=2304602 RepID=UPI00100AAFB7|nr:DUF2959 family protein [Halomonas coralii]